MERNKVQELARAIMIKIQAGGAVRTPSTWPRQSVDTLYRQRQAQRLSEQEGADLPGPRRRQIFDATSVEMVRLSAENPPGQGVPAPESAGSQSTESPGASSEFASFSQPGRDRENGQGQGSRQDPCPDVCQGSPLGHPLQKSGDAVQCDPDKETSGAGKPELTQQQLEQIQANRRQALIRKAASASQQIGPKRFDPALDLSVQSLAIVTVDLIVLHLFCGHRREGDIQWQVESSQFAGRYSVFVLSVDIVISKRCDVSKHEHREFWLNQCRGGRIVIGGAGPPCETFTVARHEEGGPPPIRHPDHFWGIRATSPKQDEKLDCGNLLLCFTLEVIAALRLRGGAGYLEHPEYPNWKEHLEPVSIWKMPAVNELAQFPEIILHSFDQCTCGQISTKPTTLLLLRMPWIVADLKMRGRNGRCNHKGGHPPLTGKNEDGTFKTSPAKVYPAALSAIIARGMLTFCAQLLHRGAQAAAVCPEVFSELHLSSVVQDATFGPDYHKPEA